MAKIIERGQPIAELVKGSLNYTMAQVRRDFYRQHRPNDDDDYFYIMEIFADHVVVESEKLATDEFYRVSYERVEGKYVFADRADWEIVELAYQPQTVTERLQGKKGQKFIEVFESTVRLSEARPNQPRRLYADGAFADVVNGNGRRYPQHVLIEAVKEALTHLHESLSQGRGLLLGEEEHPSDKRQPAKLTETIVVWEGIEYERKRKAVLLDGRLIENTKGKDAIVTMEAGVLPGISLRGYGESMMVEDDDGRVVEEVLWLRFTGFDLVMSPSFTDAGITKLESEDKTMSTDVPVKEKEVKESATLPQTGQLSAVELRKMYPDKAEEIALLIKEERELAEAKVRQANEARQREIEAAAAAKNTAIREALGLGETDDLEAALKEHKARLSQLEAEKNAREVASYVEAQVGGLKEYPDYLRENLRKAVDQAAPKTVDEAKAAIVAQRKIFDGILTEMKLRSKGMGLTILGPVLEAETGVPEFARAAFEIGESLRREGSVARKRGLHKKEQLTPAEQFAVAYLQRFDENYGQKLKAESAMFNESETTSDLNLPYSVLRAIAEEAFPDLIAANVFDFGIIDSTPARVYYESQFAGESGYETAVTGNNNVNAAAADTWYDLSHKHIKFDSISMQPSGGGTPFVFGTDYLLDFYNGRYMILSGGSMSTSTNYDLDYTYSNVARGENATIQKAKATIAYDTLNAAARRLLTNITDEAVVFSRSQLGWDAVTSTLNLLIKDLRRIINRDLFTLAISQALTVASNSGGTWNSASDNVQTLVEYMLTAKTKIENRYYTPTAFVVSNTRANDLVLWDGFTAAGSRPGFVLNGAPGYLGDIAMIPVWATTEIPDSWILACNRQVVMHRVFRAMELKGPYPSYDGDGNLLPAEQFFAQEYNGNISPIPGKAAVVKVS